MESTDELYAQYVLGNYAGFALNLDRGKGARVWDESGREYLDFCTGLAVCSLGHSHPAVASAIAAQAANLTHISNLYRNRNQGLAAKKLVEIMELPGRIFFSNSGAESNEAAIKLARKFHHETRGTDLVTPEVITFSTSFHGRTLAGIAATGQEKVKAGFGPMPEGFRHLPFNDVETLRNSIRPETAALLVEPIQGEGGVHPATKGFLHALAEVRDRHNLLLIFDEVQCGLGRGGGWCCWRELGVREIKPDAVTWAKGMGGGFPIGAIWISDRTFHSRNGDTKPLQTLLGPGTHGTTYGGSPLGAGVVLTVLNTIEAEGCIENARAQGQYAMSLLENCGSPFVREVRGKGLLIGIELDQERVHAAFGPAAEGKPAAAFLSARLMDVGLLAPPAGPGVLRWLPPLNVTRAEIDEAFSILIDQFRTMEKQGS